MGIRLGVLYCSVIVGAFSQPVPTFEVASVRPSGDDATDFLKIQSHGGPGSSDPERITYRNLTLKSLLMKAYGRTEFEIDGPAWINESAYDIAAKVPSGTSQQDFALMLQNLLTERFNLKSVRENRMVTAYQLVIGKTGAKFREDDAPLNTSPCRPAPKDKEGLPVLDPGREMESVAAGARNGHGRIVLGRKPISSLVNDLSGLLERRVVDGTGLRGKYDMVVDFSSEGLGGMAAYSQSAAPRPPAPDSPSDPVPDIFRSLQDQLGLKLESNKVSMDVLVIKEASRIPNEN